MACPVSHNQMVAGWDSRHSRWDPATQEMRELRLRCAQVPFNSASSACERGNGGSCGGTTMDGYYPPLIGYYMELTQLTRHSCILHKP